ncbi:MAG: Re/Si-specific NAD(P)(+) transhydrogenase subunit alpha [Nitrospinota bacterium]|nr:Re/Si-specific NAD(P)(+) transhydrogenase subunit alpha [Nitrospinota bacterium]
MIVGIPKETFPDEKRVALVPQGAASLTKAGFEVFVEAGAGDKSGFSDSEYTDKGAKIVEKRKDLFSKAEIIMQVRGFGANIDIGKSDLKLVKQNQLVIGLHNPLTSIDAMKELAGRKVTVFAMELRPRRTKAQSMDTLSSMATSAGYKAVLLAAQALPKMFPMLMTAAGTIAPARAFIVGAGVAGLQAIATAKRLGAVVKAYDVRDAVKEQIESLGAKFVELPVEAKDAEDSGGYAKEMDEAFYQRQREMMAKVLAESDVVITTASIPGKKAPILVTADMVKGMPKGSVIVDLAAENGGNCELTEPGKTVAKNDVVIIGPANIPSDIPYHASQMYSKNVITFLLYIIKEGKLMEDMDDEILAGTMVTKDGEIVHPNVKKLAGG